MRLIDADAFSAKLFSVGLFGGLACAIGNAPRKCKFTIGEFRGLLAKAPTIDPVHAAGGCYCRECRFRTDNGNCGHSRHEVLPPAYPNDYCSYGKRKDGVQDDE